MHTGRKHQLRLHCANGLLSPIIGDQRHGQTRAQAKVRVMGPFFTYFVNQVPSLPYLHAAHKKHVCFVSYAFFVHAGTGFVYNMCYAVLID